MKRLLSSLFFLILLSPGVPGQDNVSRKDRLEKEIEILDRQIKDNAKKSGNALSALKLTQKKVSSRKKLVAESEKQIRVLNDRITAKQREINVLSARLDTLETYYGKLVKSAYKNRDSRIWYMYILSSETLDQGFRRYGYLKNLSAQMNAQAEKITETKDRLTAEKKKLMGLKKEASALKVTRQKDLDLLKKEEADSKKTIEKLNKEKTKYQKELATKKKQMEELNRKVSGIIQQAASPKKSRPIDVKLSGEFAANKGKLPWPVQGVVVDQFGEHYHPVYKKVKLPFNNGIGIATKPGETVKSVFNGEVRQIIVVPGYNQCVLIQHGSYFTFYCKLASVSVKTGQKVKTGDKIGKVDTIGGETQLHFQVWEGRTPRNPESWLY